MKQIVTYECENCHKIFNTKEEADKHEKDCESYENIFVKTLTFWLGYAKM